MIDRDFIFYRDDTDMDGEGLLWDWEESLEFIREGENAEGLASILVSFASKFGLSGNLWRQWLTYALMMHENPFTLASERRAIEEDSSMIQLAKRDFELFMDYMKADIGSIGSSDERKMLALLEDYRPPYKDAESCRSGWIIASLAEELAASKDADEFAENISSYYKNHGAGIYGLYGAFRIAGDEEEVEIVSVTDAEDVSFDQLVGCDDQTAVLRDNTEAFLKGLPANNVLLYGDSGTGKSTSVHALMHDYAESGLRLVEITKADRSKLPAVLSEIKKRNYKFILFLDDLSFEEDESDYKELKAMLEGTLESGKDRVLVYATSNRRHLVREVWRDRNDMEHGDDVHRSDTLEEKLSLASRFGITIYFPKPNQEEYMKIVRKLAERDSLKISDKDLEDLARKWEIRHGGMSGRAAKQLITWLKAEESAK